VKLAPRSRPQRASARSAWSSHTSGLVSRILSGMIICDEIGLVFVQVPQSGSTAIGAELCDRYGGREFLAKHAGIEQARAALGTRSDRYIFVSGVRNPLDQAVSSYFKAVNDPTDGTGRSLTHRLTRTSTSAERAHFARYSAMEFSQFFCEFYSWVYAPRWLSSQRESDLVIRFESIQQGFAEALALTNTSQDRPLPLVNKTERPIGTLEDSYNERAQVRAYRVFGPFMDEWRYDFPNGWRTPTHSSSSRFSSLMYRSVPHAKRARMIVRRRLKSTALRSTL
jgi:hypothetical protein